MNRLCTARHQVGIDHELMAVPGKDGWIVYLLFIVKILFGLKDLGLIGFNAGKLSGILRFYLSRKERLILKRIKCIQGTNGEFGSNAFDGILEFLFVIIVDIYLKILIRGLSRNRNSASRRKPAGAFI